MEDDEYKVMYNLEESYWWFVGKQFLVRHSLKRLSVNDFNPEKILDIGCGTGIILKILEKSATAYGMELSPEAIGFLRKRGLRLITCSDANQSIPFKNDTFSAVTCLDVLEHLENDLTLLKEMVRVCKPDGYILITVPAFDIFWSPHDVALHHRRRYTRKQMLDNVRELHCRVIKASYYNTVLSVPILAVRKFKSFFLHRRHAQSDFFITLPDCLNRALSLLFAAEIYCLRFLDFPFGVSFLLILKKHRENRVDVEAR